MSRTAASYSMTVTRGATWEDSFDYADADGNPVDLSNYEARMQVRTLAGEFGATTTTTLLLELTTQNDLLAIQTPPGGTVPSRIAITVPPEDHAALNPDNAKKVKYAYGIELYIPQGANPEYVIPLADGKVTVKGERVR